MAAPNARPTNCSVMVSCGMYSQPQAGPTETGQRRTIRFRSCAQSSIKVTDVKRLSQQALYEKSHMDTVMNAEHQVYYLRL